LYRVVVGAKRSGNDFRLEQHVLCECFARCGAAWLEGRSIRVMMLVFSITLSAECFAPTGINQNQNAVNVIGHDNKNIQNKMREIGWQPLPTGIHHLPYSIQLHLTIDNGTKEAFPLMGTKCNEVGTGRGVVIAS